MTVTLALAIDPEIERHETAIRLQDGGADYIPVAPRLDLILVGKAEGTEPSFSVMPKVCFWS
jgi:hypothetical protein